MQIISMRLPFPPSVNALYDGGKKTNARFKSKRYREWCKEAAKFTSAWLADNPNFSVIGHPSAAWYRYGVFDDKRIRDVENYSKAISDLLVHEKIIKDDSLIKLSIAEWASDIEEGISEIVIAPLHAIKISIG